MTHHSDQGLHSRRIAIQLPYPRGGPIHYSSPSHYDISARQSRRPGTYHAESIASDYSRHARRERGRYNQRPGSPPTDPLTPPMSRRGSIHFNDQHDLSHMPEEEYQYDLQEYHEHDHSPVIITPPSSPGSAFQDQNPSIDHGHAPRWGIDHDAETTHNGRDRHLMKVTYASEPGAPGRVEYYDSQCRLTDVNGTVVVDEPEYVSDESQGSYYHDNETTRRHHRHIGPMDAPSMNQYTKGYDPEEQYPQTNKGDGDQTPRQNTPVSPGYQHDRDTRQSRIDTLRDNYGLDPRLVYHVQANRDTGYNAPNSTATVNYAKEYRASTLEPLRQPVHVTTPAYERDLSPAQSVSSFDSRYSTHSRRARHPHRAPRTYNRASSASSRESLSLVKRDRRQTHESTRIRDRSPSPVQRYEIQQVSERSRDRSISPTRKDRRRRVKENRSPLVSSSGSETEYSIPRRAKSGESMAIMVMFKSGTSRSRDSNDSWDNRAFSGPRPVGRTLAPATLAQRHRAMAETVRTRTAVNFLRSFADSLEREGLAGDNPMTVMTLQD